MTSIDSIAPFQLVVAEYHHPEIHGITSESSPNIASYMLPFETFDVADVFSGEHEKTIACLNRNYSKYVAGNRYKPHPVIRNYNNIVFPNRGLPDFKLLVVQTYELPGNELIVVNRTTGFIRLQRRIRRWLGVTRTYNRM